MDAVLLARLQFAVTMFFHFIFPPVTIGLGLILCITEWLGWRRNDEDYVRISKLFAKLFGITFAVGVASGVVMLFQFGTNWANYSKFVVNVIGGPLAVEGFFAFFLESTFIGLYLFGRGRVSKRLHWFSLLMVAMGAATLSAFFIIAANSWLQTPAGYVIREGRAELTSLFDAVFNPSTLQRYFHTVTACFFCGAFIFAGVGAWHVLRNSDSRIGRKSLRLGVILGVFFILIEIGPLGHEHALQVARTQPEKFAAIEGIYEGRNGAGLVLFAIPTVNEGVPELKAKIEIPGLASYLTHGDANAYIPGLREFPREDWPPPQPVFISYRVMLGLGGFFLAVMGFAAFRLITGKLYHDRRLLKILVWSVPLPVLACQAGWMTAEVGRQPWIVYKLMRTSEGASPNVSAGEIGLSLAVFSLVYLVLFAVWLHLMIKKAKEVPAPENA